MPAASEDHRIRGIIFDFDGLVLDTERPDFLAWQEVFAEHGCAFPLDDWAQQIGTFEPVFDAYEALEAQLGKAVDREQVRAWRRARCDELIVAETPRPGVVEYLESAHRLGLRLAVASSSPRSWVAGHLERLGLIHYFEALACGDEVPRTKPDPAVYLAALAALGLRPEEAIALEDSPNGSLAASRAGIFCIAVPHELTRSGTFAAELQLESLTEMTLEELLKAVRRHRAASRSIPT